MTLTLPVYNDRGLRALSTLGPLLRPSDTLMLVSGNVARALELSWLEASLKVLRGAFPEQRVIAATAGHAHLTRLAESELAVGCLVYIYEPFENVPEFSWDFKATQASLSRALGAVRGSGRCGIFKPTGRPLMQPSLRRYAWHYGALAGAADALFVQTQTYAHRGPETFSGAVTKLSQACAAELHKTYAQVTVDPKAPNATSPETAAACARLAEAQGLAGTTLWETAKLCWGRVRDASLPTLLNH